MEQLFFVLIPACILWTWLSLFGFPNRRTEGAVIQITPITLLARIKRHAVANILTLLVTLAVVVSGNASPWWLAVVAISAIALLCIPQSYTITTRGIRINPGSFRRWTEFAGVYRSAAGASLQVIGRGRDVRIWLAGSRGDDEFVHLLRRMIRDSYKGKATYQVTTPTTPEPSMEHPELLGIAAASPNQSSRIS